MRAVSSSEGQSLVSAGAEHPLLQDQGARHQDRRMVEAYSPGMSPQWRLATLLVVSGVWTAATWVYIYLANRLRAPGAIDVTLGGVTFALAIAIAGIGVWMLWRIFVNFIRQLIDRRRKEPILIVDDLAALSGIAAGIVPFVLFFGIVTAVPPLVAVPATFIAGAAAVWALVRRFWGP
jgi:Na+-transporting methylmalonyl-CoA/oxaloacetate decarboxylase beta subunit